MKNDLLISRLFLNGVFLSSLLCSPFILDLTLLPRFIAFSSTVLLALIFLRRQYSVFKFELDCVLLFYTLYVAICSASVLWAQNTAEAVFAAGRTWLSFFAFLFTAFLLGKREAYVMDRLMKLSILIFYVLFVVTCYQLATLKHFDKESLYAVTGLNGHKNLLASFLFLNLFFVASAVFRLKGWWEIAGFFAVVLNLVLLAVLRTKAVWLGLASAALVFGVLYAFQKMKKQPAINFYLAVAVLMLAANIFFLGFLQPAIQKSIGLVTHDAFSSEQERLIIWNKTYQLFHTRPLLGVGAGNWQVNFPDAGLSGLYRVEDLNYTFQRPHNDFLWMLSETGIIGLNAFLLFLFSVFVLVIKTLKQLRDTPPLGNQLMACTACITGYFIISFFDFPKERVEHSVFISILLAIAYSYAKRHVPVPALRSITVTQGAYRLSFFILGACVLVGLLRYSGEYYTRRLYDYKNNGKVPETIKAGAAAWNFCYTLDPTSVPVKWYTANAHASMGNYIDAKKDFLKAYRENPYNRNVLNDLASACVFSKDTAQAIAYYRETSRISPRFDDPKLNLAAIYIAQKKFNAADTCLQSVFHDSERRTKYQRLVNAFK